MHESSYIAMVLGLLGTLITTVWKFSSIVTKSTTAIENLEKNVSKIEAAVDSLSVVPELERRMDQWEKSVKIEIVSRIEALWAKVFSLDKHVAVVEREQSRHDIPTK